MSEQAIIIMTSYPNDWRKLKRLITALIKSKTAACVQRMNYVKSYYMREWVMQQKEEKLLIIKTTESKKEKAITMIKQQHPYEIPEIMIIQPHEVDHAYMTRMVW